MKNEVKSKLFDSLKINDMKKLIYIISLVAIVLMLNACSVGYVSSVPVYQDDYRPVRPGDNYIWIEGSWNWNNQTRSYYHGNGYWTQPPQNRYYEPGHWAKTRHGYRWIPGGWR